MLLVPTITRSIKPEVTTLDPDFVMHDTALCSFPGLFRHTDEWSFNSLTALKLTYVCGPLTLEVHNSELLGGHELAILQVIGGYAALNGSTVHPGNVDDDLNRDLIDALRAPDPLAPAAKPTPITEDVCTVSLSDTRLLKLLGYPVCLQYRKVVQDALLRLATVSIIVYPTGQRRLGQPMHLIAHIANKSRDLTVAKRNECGHIAINPRLTKIFMQIVDTRHTHISLKETQALGTDQVARILHQRLANWIKDGGTAVVTYRKLLSYVFPVYSGERDEDAGTPDHAGLLVDAYRRGLDLNGLARDPVFARKSAEQIKSERMAIVIKAVNKLEACLGWSAVETKEIELATLDDAATPEEREAHEKAQRQILSAQARAARDPYATGVRITRITGTLKTKRELLAEKKKAAAN